MKAPIWWYIATVNTVARLAFGFDICRPENSVKSPITIEIWQEWRILPFEGQNISEQRNPNTSKARETFKT